MGGFDWIIAVVFLISVLIGAMRGFAKEALSLAAWIVSIWLAFTFCSEAGEFVNQYVRIPNPTFRDWAGFAVIFLGGLIAFELASYLIIKLLIRGPVRGVDHVLGIGFGALRAAAIVVAFVIVGRGFALEDSGWWQNSRHIGYFEMMADSIEPLFPESWRVQTEEAVDQSKAVIDVAGNLTPKTETAQEFESDLDEATQE
ncbi:bacteriocin production protein [Arenicella chitinivorans]|uniref:Bacteriocin production protein n=1 Tax=Arenicella chitinivorans TaxID=1329800 RepID=A0A918VJF0_9GAMM|nr:CvpA family protein [Arenicella chitinivorans]GHA00759.1 bacteriocin production protein [Arenicella chitinivorans]